MYVCMDVRLGQHNCSITFQNTCLNLDLHILEEKIPFLKKKITEVSIGIASGSALVAGGRLVPILPIYLFIYFYFNK